MPAFKDLTGEVFGRLTIIKRAPNRGRRTYWECECSCGEEKEVDSDHLVSGHTKSCGCLHKETASINGLNNNVHGEATGGKYSAEYSIWKGMFSRCYNRSNTHYSSYGGRGITISEEWHTFTNFLQDMGRRPSSKLTIERLDNNKGYNKENCVWATYKVQANNNRHNRIIEYKGKTQTLSMWATELGVKYSSLNSRINREKWSIEEAFTTPIKTST